jgi:hypothetical protein
LLEKYGFREINRRYTGDLEFWFRLATHGKLLHVPEILATHRTHPHSASVSEKNSKFAEELLLIVRSLFASGALPKDIQDKQAQILSHAYYISGFYCPNEPATRLKYSLLSYFYNPQRLYWFAVGHAKAFLRFILPEKTYKALVVWRQSLRKTNP